MNALCVRILGRGTCSESTRYCCGFQLIYSFQNYAKLEAHFK